MWLVVILYLGPAFCMELQNSEHVSRQHGSAVQLCEEKWHMAHQTAQDLIGDIDDRLRFAIKGEDGTVYFQDLVRDLVAYVALEIKACCHELDSQAEDPINTREEETTDAAQLLDRVKLIKNLEFIEAQWEFLPRWQKWKPSERARRWRPDWLDVMVAERRPSDP
jgi:hypothetical protein